MLPKCSHAECDKPRVVFGNGDISLHCSKEHKEAWEKAGKPYVHTPCQLCESYEHKVLQCAHLTQEIIADMKKDIGYTDTFKFWHNVNNIAKARNYLAERKGERAVAPQNAQRAMNVKANTHGVATFGDHGRPIYFDLGGTYDLMDDYDYERIEQDIIQGKIPHAELLNPVQLGFTSRGVPVDVACSTDTGTTSIVWIKRWIRVTLQVTTHRGRNITLTQTTIGFVKRTAPLLILGKRTCAVCGYKGIEQQDADRDDEDGHKTTQKLLDKLLRTLGARSDAGGPTQNTGRPEGNEERGKERKRDHVVWEMDEGTANNRTRHCKTPAWEKPSVMSAKKTRSTLGQVIHKPTRRNHNDQGSRKGGGQNTNQPEVTNHTGATNGNEAQEEGASEDDEDGPAVKPTTGCECVHETPPAVLELPVIEEQALPGSEYAQYVSVAASQIALSTMTLEQKRAQDTAIDGYAYVGGRAHSEVETTAYIVTDKLAGSYITTAVLRRSGNHPSDLWGKPREAGRARDSVPAGDTSPAQVDTRGSSPGL